jgi:coenzyme F420-0:L-glutamate ligase/coenzyme F420-1:gamma-L-glutamate ligase
MGPSIGKRAAGEIRILPISVSGEIRAGESLCARLLTAVRSLGLRFQDGDILVVKHKVVSKAEGAVVALDEIRPSAASRAWARRYGLDARVSELAMRESRRIVRRKRGVLITETKHGFVCANSGVDVSNVDGGRHAVLLPVNPDRFVAKLRRELKKQLGIEIAVIVSDSFGRPWREGLTEVAIGVAGIRTATRCTRRWTQWRTSWLVRRDWSAASWRALPRASFAAMFTTGEAVGRGH